MSDQLPSREQAAQAVAFAYRNLKGSGDAVADLVALGIHWSSGRLIDREAIDREEMQNVFIAHASDQLDPHFSMTAIDTALDLALNAAIGDNQVKKTGGIETTPTPL